MATASCITIMGFRSSCRCVSLIQIVSFDCIHEHNMSSRIFETKKIIFCAFRSQSSITKRASQITWLYYINNTIYTLYLLTSGLFLAHFLHGGTGTYQMGVTILIVHSRHHWPELAIFQKGQWVCCLFSGVSTSFPILGGN